MCLNNNNNNKVQLLQLQPNPFTPKFPGDLSPASVNIPLAFATTSAVVTSNFVTYQNFPGHLSPTSPPSYSNTTQVLTSHISPINSSIENLSTSSNLTSYTLNVSHTPTESLPSGTSINYSSSSSNITSLSLDPVNIPLPISKSGSISELPKLDTSVSNLTGCEAGNIVSGSSTKTIPLSKTINKYLSSMLNVGGADPISPVSSGGIPSPSSIPSVSGLTQSSSGGILNSPVATSEGVEVSTTVTTTQEID